MICTKEAHQKCPYNSMCDVGDEVSDDSECVDRIIEASMQKWYAGRCDWTSVKNKLPEDSLLKTGGEIECTMCGDTFTETDLAEFQDMGEAYHREKECFLCPDCWDAYQRMPLEEQARVALTQGGSRP